MNRQIGSGGGMNQPTRTYYFQGELLGQADFIRDQQYVRDVVAIQNQCLYAPGVVMGLVASCTGSVVTATAGLAFNPAGVPVIALSPLSRDLANDKLSAGTYDLVLRYSDSITAGTPPPTMQGNHQVVEQPLLGCYPTGKGPPLGVVLGQVSVATGPQYGVDTTGRQATHALVASGTPAAAALSTDATGPRLASLAVGRSAAAPTGAPLSVTHDFAVGDTGGAAATFAFTRAGADPASVVIGAPAGTDGYDLVRASVGDQKVWAVDQTGATFSVSDVRVKADVRTLDDALATVAGLRGVSYRSRIDEGARVGLIAQEVAQALPEAVRIGADGLHALNYDAVVAVLVEAVKTLAARVATLDGGPAAVR